jgi:cobalt-zinc-cadmium efflux system outer membrane protein
MNRIFHQMLCISIACMLPLPILAEPSPTPAAGYTLRDALAKALADSPRLKGAGRGIAAAEGDAQQAGMWLNPEASVDMEDVAGSGPYSGLSSAQITYGVSQQFLIGGKLSARKDIAGKGVEIATLEQQAAALDVIRDVTRAYTDVVAAEENMKLAAEQQSLAEDVLKSVSIRVNAAAAPLIQKSRAEVERSSATIALDQATRARDIARQNLAALMGAVRFTLPLDSHAFYALELPAASTAANPLAANPDVAKLERSLEQSKAQLDLEKANAIPDPRLNIGVRDFRDRGDQAFVVGISLPIPVLNANQGNIEKARNTALRTEFDNQQTTLNLTAALSQAEQQMQNAHLRAETLRSEILPSAEKAFRLAREGYGLGRFPYLEVLDAQRSLFGVRQQRIEAIREFHTAKAQYERLTAAQLPMITTSSGASHAQ